MPRIASLVAYLLLAGCATEGAYTAQVKAWVGRSSDDLVMAWGPPQSEYPLKGGGRVLAWSREMGDTSVVTGPLSSTVHHSCRTLFTVSPEGVVKGWKWEGNGCVS